MEYIPTYNKLLETANIPENIPKLLNDYKQHEIYQSIKYYYKNLTDTDLTTFEIGNETVTSTFYDPTLEIEKFEDAKSKYVNYSEDIMSQLGYNINGEDSIWNGEYCSIQIDSHVLKYSETDYFTAKIFQRLLFAEAAKAYSDVNKDIELLNKKHYPLRETYLSNKKHFEKTATRSTGGSVGGVIFGKQNGQWYMLLCKRSKDTDVNSGFYSIVPNGGIEYDTIKEESFVSTLKKEFDEEISPPDEHNLFDQHIEYTRLCCGWNCRTGNLCVGYGLYIYDESKFRKLINKENKNFELQDVIKINITDKDKVLNHVNDYETSPSTIPTIYRGLQTFNARNDLPGLGYHIKEI